MPSNFFRDVYKRQGPLHAHQADAELILHQFAHCPHPAVAQVIDVVHHADVLAQLQQICLLYTSFLHRRVARIDHHIRFEVEDGFQIAKRNVQQVADA